MRWQRTLGAASKAAFPRKESAQQLVTARAAGKQHEGAGQTRRRGALEADADRVLEAQRGQSPEVAMQRRRK